MTVNREKSPPLLSIVMPLFNKEGDVERAVLSVLAQTAPDFELLVVDDGSTDRGPDIVSGFDDPRICIIRQENAGVSAARNRGVAAARADLIAFLDADDQWLPDFLAAILRLRHNFPDCSVFATGYIYHEADGWERPAIVRGCPAPPWEGVLADYFTIAARSDPPLWSSAIAVTREAIDSIGGFPVGLTAGEDLLTWARLAMKYRIAYAPFPHAVFWIPSGVHARPGRFGNTEDVVGRELASWHCEAEPPLKAGLRDYAALWHRMRAVIFLQLGKRWQCLAEIYTAVKYSGPTIRLSLVLCIALLPFGLPRRAFFMLKRAQRFLG